MIDRLHLNVSRFDAPTLVLFSHRFQRGNTLFHSGITVPLGPQDDGATDARNELHIRKQVSYPNGPSHHQNP